MDPNANLQAQERTIAALAALPPPYARQPHHRVAARIDTARLAELRQALYDWIRGGGFAPSWESCPLAAAHYADLRYDR